MNIDRTTDYRQNICTFIYLVRALTIGMEHLIKQHSFSPLLRKCQLLMLIDYIWLKTKLSRKSIEIHCIK